MSIMECIVEKVTTDGNHVRVILVEEGDSRFKLRSIRDILIFDYSRLEKNLPLIVDAMEYAVLDYSYKFLPSDKTYPAKTSRRKLFKLIREEIKSVMEPQNV